MTNPILEMPADELERQMKKLFSDINALPHEEDRLYVMRELNGSLNRVSKEILDELATLDASPSGKARVRKFLEDMVAMTARNVAKIDERIEMKAN